MEPISGKPKKKTAGRRRIPIQKIQDKSKRHVAFSKRRMGLFKKASELCTLCDSEVAIIVVSEADRVFTFGHPSADSVIQRYLHGSSSFPSSSPSPSPSPAFGSVQTNSDPPNCNQISNSVAQTTCNAVTKFSGNGGGFWWEWESPVDSLGLEELRLYAKSLQVLMSNVAAKATSMASSSSDVAVGTAYPSTAIVDDLESNDPRSTPIVNDGSKLDELEFYSKYLEELNGGDVQSAWNGFGESQQMDSLRWEDIASHESVFWEEGMVDGDMQSDMLTTWWV